MAHLGATAQTLEEAREFCRAVLRAFPWNQDHPEGASL